MLTPEETFVLAISEDSTEVLGIGTITDNGEHIQNRTLKNYSESSNKELSFVSNGFADLFTQNLGTVNLEYSLDFLKSSSAKNNQNVFKIPDGAEHCIPVCRFIGTTGITNDVYTGIKLLVVFLKENTQGLLEISGFVPNHPFLKLQDFGNYNSVTYITDDAPLTREYHLCADQTNTMIHCMGADYMTMIPMYLSYGDANLLTDIKVYPQFINNTLYDNQNTSIVTITNQNHRRLFTERQSNFTSSEWPLVSFS